MVFVGLQLFDCNNGGQTGSRVLLTWWLESIAGPSLVNAPSLRPSNLDKSCCLPSREEASAAKQKSSSTIFFNSSCPHLAIEFPSAYALFFSVSHRNATFIGGSSVSFSPPAFKASPVCLTGFIFGVVFTVLRPNALARMSNTRDRDY